MSASTRPSHAALLITITLAAMGIAAAASAGTADGDGAAIVLEAVDGTREGEAVYVDPSGSDYRFAITAVTDDGEPIDVARLAVGLGSVSALDETDASSVDAPWQIEGFVQANLTVHNDGDNTVVVEVPHAATGFGRSFPTDGLAPFAALLEAPDGSPIVADDGGRPWAVVNTDVEDAVDEGNFETADRNDRSPTPVRLRSEDLPATVERGQPLLNPEFTLVEAAEALDDGDRPAVTAAHSWTLTVDDEEGNAVAEPDTQASEAFWVEGDALDLDVAAGDVADGRTLRLVQHLSDGSEPVASTPQWTEVETVDARLRVLDSPSATVAIEARFADGTNADVARDTFSVTDDENWASLTLDVVDACEGSTCGELPLQSVSLELLDASDAEGLHLQVDSVEATGAQAGPVTMKTSPQDDHVVDLDPTGGQPTIPASRAVSVDATETAAGQRYLIDVGVENLTSNAAVPGHRLAEGHLQVGRLDPRAGLTPDRWSDTYDDPASDGDTATDIVHANGVAFTVGAQLVEGQRIDTLVRAFDAENGDVFWTTTWDGPVSGVDIPYQAVASPDGSTLYLAGVVENQGTGTDYLLLALDATTGEVLWNGTYNDPTMSATDYATQIEVSGDGSTLFLSGYVEEKTGLPSMRDWTGLTLAMDTDSHGDILWTYRHNNTAAYIAPAPDEDSVYLLTLADDPEEDANLDFGDMRVMKLDARSGALHWGTYVDPDDVDDLPYGIEVSPDGEHVYIAGLSDDPTFEQFDFLLASLDADTGSIEWLSKSYRAGFRKAMRFDMSPDGERLAISMRTPSSFTHHDWDTIAFDAEDGSMLWERFFQGPRGLLGYTPMFGNFSAHAYPDYGRPTDVTFSADGERVHVVGYGYENGNAPGSRTYTVTYDAATGEDVWMDAVDQNPVGRDEPTAATLEPETGTLLVAGYTDASVHIPFAQVRLYIEDAEMVTLAYPSESSGLDRFATDLGVYQHAGEDQAVAVVDASELPPGTTTTAWYGVSLTPNRSVAGFHSLAKDPARGTPMADALDMAATPLTFTGSTTGTQAHAFEIVDVEETDGDTIVHVRGQAPYLEAAQVQLAVGDDRFFNTTKPVGPGDTATVTFPGVSLPETGVRITVLDGEFHEGDIVETGAPAVGPLSIEAPVELANLTDGHTVQLDPGTLADRDLSPCVEAATWTITDGTMQEEIDVSDEDGDGCLDASEARLAYTFADEGDWTVQLAARDDEGHTETASLAVSGVANAPPTFGEPALDVTGDGLVQADALVDAWTVRAGLELTLVSEATDPSRKDEAIGTVRVQASDVYLPQDDGSYAVGDLDENLTLEAGKVAFTPPSPGSYNLTVNWTDEDGASIETEGVLEATDPLVSIQAIDLHAEVDGQTAGTQPLAGETLVATVDVLFAGDRPDGNTSLRLLDPSGSLLANDTEPTVTSTSLDGVQAVYTYTLESTVADAGDHRLELSGGTLAGLDLSTVLDRTITVDENQAPSVELTPSLARAEDGKVYMEASDRLRLVAQATDPDCTDGGPRCDLALDWSLGSRAAQLSETEVLVDEPEPHADATGSTIALAVSDHQGQQATASLTYVVDDHVLASNLTVLEAAGTVTDGQGRTVHVVPDPAVLASGFTVEANVTSDLGTALDGQALWSAAYQLHPWLATEEEGLTTDGSDAAEPFADGTLSLHVEPGLIDAANGPGLYTVDVLVHTPPGRIDRPDQGADEESTSLAVHVWIGPWVGPDGEVVA